MKTMLRLDLRVLAVKERKFLEQTSKQTDACSYLVYNRPVKKVRFGDAERRRIASQILDNPELLMVAAVRDAQVRFSSPLHTLTIHAFPTLATW
jgi:hypothetical protein